MASAEQDWERVVVRPWLLDERELPDQVRTQTPLALAERATVSKMAVEARDLRAFARELAPDPLTNDQVKRWAAAGRMLYLASGANEPVSPRAVPPLAGVLDDTSRALVVRLHNAAPPELRATEQDVRAMVARLEQTIIGDTALNQLRLRPKISREIVRRDGRIDFPALNAWIYAQVFRTPSEDAWLGLLQRDVFTGLPGDGVARRGTR